MARVILQTLLAIDLAPDTVFAILSLVRSAGPAGCTIDELVKGLWPNGRQRLGKPPVPKHKLPGGAGQMAQQCVARGLVVKFGERTKGHPQGHVRYRLTRAGEAYYARTIAELNALAEKGPAEGPAIAAGDAAGIDDGAQDWTR